MSEDKNEPNQASEELKKLGSYFKQEFLRTLGLFKEVILKPLSAASKTNDMSWGQIVFSYLVFSIIATLVPLTLLGFQFLNPVFWISTTTTSLVYHAIIISCIWAAFHFMSIELSIRKLSEVWLRTWIVSFTAASALSIILTLMRLDASTTLMMVPGILSALIMGTLLYFAFITVFAQKRKVAGWMAAIVTAVLLLHTMPAFVLSLQSNSPFEISSINNQFDSGEPTGLPSKVIAFAEKKSNNDPKKMAAILQLARASKAIADRSIDHESASEDEDRAVSCLQQTGLDFFEINPEIERLIFDTPARARAFIAYNRHFSGKMLSLRPEESDDCDE